MSYIDELNKRYFNGELSRTVLASLAPVDSEGPEVQAFVRRAFEQLHRQRVGARDFPEVMAWAIASVVPKILPGVWGGAVPPITRRGRHVLIDEYLAKNPWRAVRDGDRLLDIGCGFPPFTTLDTAERFPKCRITGADPSLGAFLIRETNGSYAVLNAAGELIYYQAGTAEQWKIFRDDPARIRELYAGHLAALRGSLPEDDDGFSSIERDGVTLVHNPVREFSRKNVNFSSLGIGSDELSGYDLVRCFNVIFYFDDDFRQTTLDWLTDVLVDGGIFICGVDGTVFGCERFAVYRAENGSIVPKEFAFSVDNIRPLEVISIFALQDDDRDRHMMASLIGVLRSDDGFRGDFDKRLDELVVQHGMGARKPDGYLGPLAKEINAERFIEAAKVIRAELERDGFNRRAVDVLQRHGYDAWVNCIGDVAIDPAGHN